MWVARDKNGELNLYKTKPFRNHREEFWEVDDLENMILLPSDLLPEIRWEEGPDEITLKVKEGR